MFNKKKPSVGFNVSAVFVLGTNYKDFCVLHGPGSAAESRNLTSYLNCENLRNIVTSKSRKHTAVTMYIRFLRSGQLVSYDL